MNKIAVLTLAVNIVTHETPFHGGFRETEYKTLLLAPLQPVHHRHVPPLLRTIGPVLWCLVLASGCFDCGDATVSTTELRKR